MSTTDPSVQELELADETPAAPRKTTRQSPKPRRTPKAAKRPSKKMPLTAKLALFWLSLVVFGAIYAKLDNLLGQRLPLQDPRYQGNLFGTASRTETPSTAHFLGTDVLSRDSFARLVHGGWVSLIVAMSAVSFGVVFGGIIGTFAGYVKGRTERVIMALIDVILAFPALVLLLAMVSIFQVRSLTVISLVIGLLAIPAYTRIARANTLALANREFVHAAQAIGTKRFTIMFREIFPNVLPTLLAYALVNAAAIIVIEGTLSFLGLSVQLPEPTWGNMINEGRSEIRQTILPVLWPSLALTLTVLSLNQVGDWLQGRAEVRSAAL